MGFFKCLGYVAAGVGAVVLAPATGGSSIALAIGALGTTTAAGAAIGVGLGATAAAVDHAVTSNNEAKENAYRRGVSEGKRAGEQAAQRLSANAQVGSQLALAQGERDRSLRRAR